MNNREDKTTFWLPEYKMETLANSFLPAIREYFETPEGQETFNAWQAEQKELNIRNKSNDAMHQ